MSRTFIVNSKDIGIPFTVEEKKQLIWLPIKESTTLEEVLELGAWCKECKLLGEYFVLVKAYRPQWLEAARSKYANSSSDS